MLSLENRRLAGLLYLFSTFTASLSVCLYTLFIMIDIPYTVYLYVVLPSQFVQATKINVSETGNNRVFCVYSVLLFPSVCSSLSVYILIYSF